ncbi:AAA family ATPase [Nocardioides psychrotolerans]|uniref:ATP-dependent nuclease n=1 Tax=Nocardioides psychrotolerans TaxID=1005945 RepID=UPI0031382534
MGELPAGLVQSLDGTNLTEGQATEMLAKISSFELGDGSTVSPPAVGVTVVVGPNNAGKSTLLREIHTHLNSEYHSQPFWRLVKSLSLEVAGTPADVVAWLAAHNRYSADAEGGFRSLGGANVSTSWLRQVMSTSWAQAGPTGRLGSTLAPFLVQYANTDSRLEQSKAAPARNDAREPATHPVHVLADDRVRLHQASGIASQVFGEALWLDDYSAQHRLRVGELLADAPRRDEIDAAYRDELLSLPELAQQGDGMRSFFGLLLPLLAASFPIVLVDEPEAFLHPPQAAALGRQLGRLSVENELQVVIATHDRHLLTGLLESKTPLTIVRVDRFSQGTGARQIDPIELTQIWDEPALRYSNALDGLFHRLVVLVEGDRDARFYAASLDVANEIGEVNLPVSEVLFVPCGGKGGMAKIAKALRGLGVPVVAVPDIDLLSVEAETRKLVEALGGDWTDFESDFAAATARISKDASALQVCELAAVLGDDPTAPLTKELRRSVERVLKTAGSGWNQVKAGGVSALGAGGVGAAAARLLDALDVLGLVVVRVGELESFAPDLDVSKGSNWVPAALAAEAHRSPEALAHVRRLGGALAGQQE